MKGGCNLSLWTEQAGPRLLQQLETSAAPVPEVRKTKRQLSGFVQLVQDETLPE